jgi:hypothetical protein
LKSRATRCIKSNKMSNPPFTKKIRKNPKTMEFQSLIQCPNLVLLPATIRPLKVSLRMMTQRCMHSPSKCKKKKRKWPTRLKKSTCLRSMALRKLPSLGRCRIQRPMLDSCRLLTMLRRQTMRAKRRLRGVTEDGTEERKEDVDRQDLMTRWMEEWMCSLGIMMTLHCSQTSSAESILESLSRKPLMITILWSTTRAPLAWISIWQW